MPSTQVAAQGQANRALGGCSLGRGLANAQAWQPSVRCLQPQRTRFQPGTWDLLAAASHMPPPNSAIHSESTHMVTTVQNSAFHNESTHSA